MGQHALRKIQQHAVVDTTLAGQRLDRAASQLFSQFSRSRLTTWIKSGELQVNNQKVKPSYKLLGGETLDLNASVQELTPDQPEDMPLDIVYEDEALLVINKPTNLVVHPAAGHPSGTLLNGLLNYDPQLNGVPRAGIVHRLDKNTTGLMVVARSLESQIALAEQLQDKSLHREYEAIAVGVMTGGATVNAPIGRHHKDRKKQAVTDTGKPSVTHYIVEQRYRGHTLIQVRLETGRTHQIRVHMAYKHYPLVGDPAYGGRLKFPAGASEALRQALQQFPRQALHARKLGLIHPYTGEYMEFEAPRPDDLQQLINALRDDQAQQ